jgi:hypothetical protein
MDKKDLILITSYCPTNEKKEILLTLLKGLQKYRNEYDILLSSHVKLDPFFFDYFDYFYFDKNNQILTDIEYRQNGWFVPFENYVIWSNYITPGNTMKAIWDMVIPSISIAKSLNYEKIHYLEYDSEVITDGELKDNSKLLETYDYVIYRGKDTHKLIGAFFSFKTNSVIDEQIVCNDGVYERLFFGKYPKAPENAFFDLIKEQRTYFTKEYDPRLQNGIILNKICSPTSWNVPFYDPKDNKLKFISNNASDENFSIKIIVDGILRDLGVVKPNHWKIVNIEKDFNTISRMVVLNNDCKILEIDFSPDDFKEKFILYNSALTNSSLGVK